ncbi:uncharacterized protein LOC100841653 [Brachypodium distachyon]|uniref:Uncharacterized protein n=1 Tax=Brachypodium distachyon TaxID=15368 RepID=A0A0Q3HUA8_BRADI|nr:uncharacterized protein LOC100841653 [Brachypodium distachyon]XP_010234826.1 uncharacterized protein LOC100841653 [Brachypodium distachyon]KQJ97113.1 hypothetical protein BRADI_3g28881v3 [Brachypodium distachyon]KQJ97114.1 hypothetical protein BRADI_3g28881v3 [Brachypodium distachyon]|eukprot:XP_003574064.1 uncharacterized protein LOC100841653 [Brachypodium distachyon]
MGSSSPAVPDPALALGLRHPGALARRIAMARGAAVAPALRPWLADAVPLVVVVLIAAHVLALGYWIYRLATDGSKLPGRSKKH